MTELTETAQSPAVAMRWSSTPGRASSGTTLGRRDLDRRDRLLTVAAWGVHDTTELALDHRWALRGATITLLSEVPELTGDMHSWTHALRTPYSAALALLTNSPRSRPGDRLRAASETR